MRPGGGKAKGGQFERDVCRKLSFWVTRGKRGDCFWRSAMSGGRGTMFKGVRQVGDITACAPEGMWLTSHYYIECKYVRDLSLTRFFISANGGRDSIFEFWKTARWQAGLHKLRPMLIAKQNFMPTIVVLTLNDPLLGDIRYCTVDEYAVALFDDLLNQCLTKRMRSK